MQRLTGKTSLAKKLTGIQHPDDAFLALFRYDGDLNVAGLNVEDCIGRVALSEDELAALVTRDAMIGVAKVTLSPPGAAA